MEKNKNKDLPIGRDTENVLKEWLKMYKDLPKTVKYSVYPVIISTISQMISDVYFANALKEERKFHLTNYIARLQIIKGLSRTIHEIKAISHKKSDFLFTLYENLSQQAVKWKNYSRVSQ